MIDSLTILHAHSGRRLGKLFTTATNGIVVKRDYDCATWFTAEAANVTGIRDVLTVLRRLETERYACVIRGALAEGIDPQRVRRKKVGAGSSFVECARRWLMLDVDGIPLPAGTSIIESPTDAAHALLDLLAAHAPELEGVTAIVQFSSSAALDELAAAEAAAGMAVRWDGVVKRGVAAHVWLWLSKPTDEAELKRWMAKLAASGLEIDHCTNRTVQPHYTAAPIFEAPLRDPLAGRRTVLIEGWADEAELQIPDIGASSYSTGVGTSTAYATADYGGFLAGIGGAHGFRNPMLRAVLTFLAANWPAIDVATLKADIRAGIKAADPGRRPDAVLATYASDAHLDQMIAWAREREQENRAKAKAAAEQPVEPTFPDRSVTLEDAVQLANDALAVFAARVADGERPDLLLRVTVGSGKSEAAIDAVPALLAAAKAAGRPGALYYAVPRHDLGDQLLARFRERHPHLSVAILRGMDQPDPRAPADDVERKMCADRELSRAAMMAGQHATAACKACPHYPRPGMQAPAVCGYERQRMQKADVWLVPHNALFQSEPRGLPDAAVVVIDENFTGAALKGQDIDRPVQLGLTALDDDRTGPLTGADRERLLFLRKLARDALAMQTDDGGLRREPFLSAGFAVEALGHTIPDTADEWADLEWRTKPKVKIRADMDRNAALAVLDEAAEQGFTTLRPVLAKWVRDLLKGTDARSVNATLLHNAPLGRDQGAGDVVRFEWREDFAEWIAGAPKLLLDATTPADLLKVWAPDIKVVDIEVQAPHQRVRQIIGAEFGRTAFVNHPANVRRLADLVVLEVAATAGDVLVIAQKAVKKLLSTELLRRFGTLPTRLILAHHGAITGMNEWRDVARLVVVGRPATNRLRGERMAELLRGAGLGVITDGDEARWPTVTAGIRLADGTGRAVRQPRHPDELVEAVRWNTTEGAVIQAIGRCRGVRRTAETPVAVTLMAELALPVTMEEVAQWDDAQPGRVLVAAAEAVIMRRALPLGAADLARARPDLWTSEKAAEHDLARGGNTPQTPIIVLYRALGGISAAGFAHYRRVGARGRLCTALVPIPGGHEALEAIVGPLAAYEPVQAGTAPGARSEAPTPAPAAPPTAPAAALSPTDPGEVPLAAGEPHRNAVRAGGAGTSAVRAPPPKADGELSVDPSGYGEGPPLTAFLGLAAAGALMPPDLSFGLPDGIRIVARGVEGWAGIRIRPAPSQPGTLFVLGDAPPWPLDLQNAAPAPTVPARPRLVPDVPSPVLRANLAALAGRLEAVRPPQLWGDEFDEMRIEAWRARVARVRPATPPEAEQCAG